MQLVKLNPTRDVFNFRRRMDSVFDDFLGSFFNGSRTDLIQGWLPKVDVFEEDDHIVMKAELPGVEKDQISIDVDGRVLTLKGERSVDKEVNEERCTLRERSYGRFERTFTLPAETDVEQIKAVHKDGVLELNIPKPASSKPKQITIQ